MKRLLALALALPTLAACLPIPPAPPLVPEPVTASYHAVGTEPFWSLTIGASQTLFEEPNRPTRIVEPTPKVIHGVAGEIYQGARIKVNIVHGHCSDGMSGRVYPDSVQLGIDGKSYRGCGGL